MNSFFQRAFPRDEHYKSIFVKAAFIAILVYLFLALFQPFGTYTFHHSLKYFILVPYALIIFVTSSTVKIYVKNRKTDNWKVQDELISIVTVLFVSSLFNYFYNLLFIRQSSFHISELLWMILFSFALGIPIFAIYFFAVLGFQKELKTETIFEEQPILREEGKTFQINELQINDGNKNFILAKSEGNYCYIYFLNEGVPEKKLIRISLVNVEEQLAGEQNIIRCHRSFIINKFYISSKKGNAQGYKLVLKYTDETIPVSRNYISALN